MREGFLNGAKDLKNKNKLLKPIEQMQDEKQEKDDKKQTTLYLSKSTLKELRILAAQMDVKMSDIVQDAINQKISELKGE